MTSGQSACHCHKLYCLLYVMLLNTVVVFFVTSSWWHMGWPVYSVKVLHFLVILTFSFIMRQDKCLKKGKQKTIHI